MKTKESFLSELAPVRWALEAWRKSRKPRQPIPETLWRQMTALARTHGVSPVSQALRLDYNSLKGRVAQTSATQSPSSSGFVELKFPPSSDYPAACVAQLEDGQGRKLTLRWASAPAGDLLGLVQAFWKESA